MTTVEKEMKQLEIASLRCNQCPDINTCSFISKQKLREVAKEKIKQHRPRGVHICLLRQSNIDYRCEQCLVDDRKRFMNCDHKDVNKSQTDLTAFTGVKKPRPVQTDVEEVK